MDVENLENFFNTDDGLIKNFNGKVHFCTIMLIFFLIYLVLYLCKKITVGSFVFVSVLLNIAVVLLIILCIIKSNEARDNFYTGYCSLAMSLVLWYSAILFVCHENGKMLYIVLGYFCVWIGSSIIICFGVLKNIKLNLYRPGILKNRIKLDSNREAYLVLGKSTKLMILILILGELFQIVVPTIYMGDLFRFNVHFQIIACILFFIGWLGLFGWKLVLKAVLLKKYTINC